MMTMTRKQLRDVLDTEEFYDLMQAYRHADVADQSKVCDCYEEVKTYILNQHAALVEQRDQLVEALRSLMTRFEQTGEAWMSDPAMQQARELLTTIEQGRETQGEG